MSELDVIVIGAGAAGLAAARRLATARLSVRVLEARNRLGGRAWTWRDADGLPIELGCGWLHSADENEWCIVAATLGFAIDRTRPAWRTQWNNIGFPPSDQDDFRAAAARFYDRLDAAGEAEIDQPGDRFLEPGCRWNALIDATSTYINGVELDQLSARDFWRYRDTGVNWRVVEGYGTLVAATAAGLDVALDCPADVIDHGGRLIRIETPRGELRARAIIVTVPTTVLAAGMPRFTPALPAKIAAAQGLPLGLADKLYLRLDGAQAFPADSHLYGAVDRVRTGSYHLRPLGRPLIEGYFGGASKPARGRSQASPSTSSPRFWAATSASTCIRSPPPPGRATRTRRAPTPTPCPARPMPGRRSLPRSTSACSSRERRVPMRTSRPPTAPTAAASARRSR
jgi:monoamine oxidase